MSDDGIDVRKEGRVKRKTGGGIEEWQYEKTGGRTNEWKEEKTNKMIDERTHARTNG